MRAPSLSRFASALGRRTWFGAGAAVLTLVWLLARSLAPTGGLVRTYYYPVPLGANPLPLPLDVRGVPAVEERAGGVDLDFLDELGRPGRNYVVRWRGVWFSPRAERIDLVGPLSRDDGDRARGVLVRGDL